MKRLTLLFVLILALVLVSSAMAQGGEGGTIFVHDTSDPSTLNPMLGGDTTSSAVYTRIYPQLFNVDANTGAYSQDTKGTMATSWEYNEDGTVLTVHLRDDAYWNDGTQITANDYIWMADALRSGLLDSPRPTQMFALLDDGTEGSGSVDSVVALDDFTLEFTFTSASCQTQGDINPWFVPSHIYEEDFGDDLAAMNDDPMYLPGVSFGAWQDPEILAGDRWAVVADQTFPDTELGYVAPAERVTLNLADSDVALERFRAGELTAMGIPGEHQDDFLADENFQTYQYERRGYVFYAFNHSDPSNPQPAYDEDGNWIDQDPHPVLGDKMVRQALVMSVDMDSAIENFLGGKAVRVGIPSIPASWDWNPDLLYPFDPVGAAEMLEEAGWSDTDGNGIRECVACAQMQNDAAYEGTEMALTLNASDGGSEQTNQMIEFIAQSMRDVGVDANVEFMDWGSAFLPELDGQTFDMAILAWSLGLPLDPDGRWKFGSHEDVPGSGFNFGSYVDQELDQMYEDAINPALTDGCSIEGRKAIYDEINQKIFEDLPYMFMYANLRMYAAQGNVENWDPGIFVQTWQEDAWDTVGGN